MFSILPGCFESLFLQNSIAQSETNIQNWMIRTVIHPLPFFFLPALFREALKTFSHRDGSRFHSYLCFKWCTKNKITSKMFLHCSLFIWTDFAPCTLMNYHLWTLFDELIFTFLFLCNIPMLMGCIINVSALCLTAQHNDFFYCFYLYVGG